VITITDLVQTIQHTYRQEGWRSVARLLVLPFFEFHRAYVLGRSLQEPIQLIKPKLDLEFKMVTRDDLGLFENVVPPLRIRRFAKRIETGEMCIIALLDGKNVAFSWASPPDGPSVKETPLKLGPREVYLWGAYCLPPYRSQGIMSVLTLNLFRRLQEQGYERALLLTDQHNKPVLKLAPKIGVQIVTGFTSLRIFKWRIFRYSAASSPLFQKSTLF